MDKEFCLLDEPWIKVLDQENTIKEVSLLDVFRDAHKYKSLAGETVTQDASILRLLLAIAITVFYRYDVDGQEDNVLEYEDPEKVILERWSEYWKKGAFKADTFQKYLETYKERFFLFHPETPFWQVADLKDGTNYGIINLYGNIKESKNTKSKHHFNMTDGEYVENISKAEAARWLVFNNAYSKMIKYRGENSLKNAEVGWVSELGLIVVDSDNLYKLLLLNLCALYRGEEAWGEPRPIWEVEFRASAGHGINIPDNLPELYTIQSRKVCLQQKNNKIFGYFATRGDYYSANNMIEPMTLLKYNKNNDIVPEKHNKTIEMWKEFSTLLPIKNEIKPGIIFWIQSLREISLFKENIITFQMIGLEFEDEKKYKSIYGDQINESLSLSAEFLDNIGREWITRITDQVENCEKVRRQCYSKFARTLLLEKFKINSNSKEKTEFKKQIENKIKYIEDRLATAYYYRINRAFREWLISIKPGESKKEEKEYEWQQTSSKIAESVVVDYISGIDPQHIMICAKAVGVFKKNLYKIYPGMGKKGGDEDEQEK